MHTITSVDSSLATFENIVNQKLDQDKSYCHYHWSTLDLQCYDPITYSAFSSFSLMSPLITSAGMMSSVIYNGDPRTGSAKSSSLSVTTIFTPSSSVHYLIGSTNIKPTVMFISIPSTRTEILSSSLDHSPTSVAYYSSLSTSPASSTFSRPGSSLDLSDPKLLGAFAAVLVLLIIIIILVILLSICCYMKCKQPVKSSVIQGFDNPDNNGESLAKKIEILWSCVIKLT